MDADMRDTITTMAEDLKHNNRQTDRLLDIVDGTNGDGLRVKVGKALTHIKIHWVILFLIISGLLYGRLAT